MLPPTAPTPAPVSGQDGPVTESFVSIVARRTRYVLAIAICAYLYYTIGWRLVSATQTPGLATAALFQGSIVGGVIAAIGLLVLLLVGMAIGEALAHPDVPHMGLYCACLGLAALVIRGGSIQLMAREAQVNNHTGALFAGFAMESVVWLVILLALDAASLWIFSRFFNNVKWLKRFGSSPNTPDVLLAHPIYNTLIDISLPTVQKTAAKHNPLFSSLGALAVTSIVGTALLFVFARTELIGQTLFACIISFGVAGFAAQRFFPRAGTWAVWAGVCTAAVAAFLIAGQFAFPFPGHIGFPPARCLPMDYVAAGIPGAILGYYSGLRWRIHSLVHEQ
jgi:hypothetical protein